MLSYKSRKLIKILQQITNSHSTIVEDLALQAREAVISEHLSHLLLELADNPHRFEVHDDLFDEIIERLESEMI